MPHVLEQKQLPYLNLNEQRILVVGGGSRMGLSVAKLTAALGVEVIISMVRLKNLLMLL